MNPLIFLEKVLNSWTFFWFCWNYFSTSPQHPLRNRLQPKVIIPYCFAAPFAKPCPEFDFIVGCQPLGVFCLQKQQPPKKTQGINTAEDNPVTVRTPSPQQKKKSHFGLAVKRVASIRSKHVDVRKCKRNTFLSFFFDRVYVSVFSCLLPLPEVMTPIGLFMCRDSLTVYFFFFCADKCCHCAFGLFSLAKIENVINFRTVLLLFCPYNFFGRNITDKLIWNFSLIVLKKVKLFRYLKQIVR